MFFSRIGPFRIVWRKKNFFREHSRRATRDRATGAIFELKYLRKLKRNRCPVFFCCSQSLFCTFCPKIIEICIVLSEIFSKNLQFWPFTWILRSAGFFFGMKSFPGPSYQSPLGSDQKLAKFKESFPRKVRKTCILTGFRGFYVARDFFFGNPALSLCSSYRFLTSCKKSEKSKTAFLRYAFTNY